MRSTINRYFEEVGRLSLPTAASERESFARYAVLRAEEELQTDPVKRKEVAARRAALGGKIVTGYLRFVIGKACEYTRDRDTLMQDLISAGNVGLMIALNKFDPTLGYKFLTYASWWVRVQMDTVIHTRKQVHPSIHGRKQAVSNARGDSDGDGWDAPVDPVLTPADDVQLDAGVDVERDVHGGEGRLALRYLRDAGLGLLDRMIVSMALGLRGRELSDEEIALAIYSLDGSLVTPREVAARREAALARLRAWVDEDAAEDVLAELSA